jgi:protein TonB
MPYLLHPIQTKPDFEQIVASINVVRIKQPDTPVKRKSEEILKPLPDPQQPKPTPRLPVKVDLVLPFAVNPKLPAGPDTLVLPPAALDTAGFEDIFSMGELDAPLTVLARIPPDYPLHAKHRGIEGWVRVGFVVHEDGSVGNVAVLESKPPGIFDQNVIRCVSGWRFQAGTIGGLAVKTRAETTIRFKLE